MSAAVKEINEVMERQNGNMALLSEDIDMLKKTHQDHERDSCRFGGRGKEPPEPLGPIHSRRGTGQGRIHEGLGFRV